jgi:hypothetical protein
MKVGESFDRPESSFLIIDKDLEKIANKMLTNPRLLKLLHYRTSDALSRPNLTAKEKVDLIGDEIKIVPKLDIDKECPIYVIITFDNFTPNATNPEFRDCTVNFDIFCHPDHWNLGNFQLRPYKIAGELDAMFNKAKMTGIGTLQFAGANNLVLND